MMTLAKSMVQKAWLMVGVSFKSSKIWDSLSYYQTGDQTDQTDQTGTHKRYGDFNEKKFSNWSATVDLTVPTKIKIKATRIGDLLPTKLKHPVVT